MLKYPILSATLINVHLFSTIISVRTHFKINLITIRNVWYANDMAVANGTYGAKIGVFSFVKLKNHFELLLNLLNIKQEKGITFICHY